MPDPVSLTYQVDDYRKAVAHQFLGYGRDATAWSADQIEEMDDYIRQAYAGLLNPDPVTDGGDKHVWSFLRPVTNLTAWGDIAEDAGRTITGVKTTYTTLTANVASFYPTMVGASIYITKLAASHVITEYVSSTVVRVATDATVSNSMWSMTATGDYPLPSTFGGHFGDITRARGSQHADVALTGEGEIRRLRQRLDQKGLITHVAVRPSAAATGATSQAWEILVFPQPEEATELWYAYTPKINAMDDNHPYPIGPQWFSELLLDACLATVEQRVRGAEGPMTAKYLRRLRAAILEDQRSSAPDTLGRMRPGMTSYSRMPRGGLVTYVPTWPL